MPSGFGGDLRDPFFDFITSELTLLRERLLTEYAKQHGGGAGLPFTIISADGPVVDSNTKKPLAVLPQPWTVANPPKTKAHGGVSLHEAPNRLEEDQIIVMPLEESINAAAAATGRDAADGQKSSRVAWPSAEPATHEMDELPVGFQASSVDGATAAQPTPNPVATQISAETDRPRRSGRKQPKVSQTTTPDDSPGHQVSALTPGSDAKSVGSSVGGEGLIASFYGISAGKRRKARVPKNLPPLIAHPEMLWYKIWSRWISLLIVVTIFYTPMQVAFMDRSSIATQLPPLMIDSFFAIDIFIQFNLAIDHKAVCVTDRREIALSYVSKGRFFTDIISTVPFGIAWDLIDGFRGMSEYEREVTSLILALLPLARIYRILLFLRAMQEDSRFNLLGVVVGKVVLFILISTHTAGCIFYAIAKLEGFDEDTWIGTNFESLPGEHWTSRYVHVLYWAVASFKAGPASGNLFPVSEREMILACCSMVVNICLQTYLVSSMSALLTTADLSIYAFRRRLKQVMEFASQRGLPRQLREHVKEYLAFKFSANDDLERDVLAALPELYRQRISHALYKEVIVSMPFFAECDSSFMWQIHGVLHAGMHAAQTNVMGAGEPATKLHILAKGEVGLYSNEELCETRHRGEGIGEIPFICKKVHAFTVNTHVPCRLLSISREDWEGLVSAHPEASGQIKQNVEADCLARIARLEDGVLRTVYQELLANIRANMIESKEATVGALCFATARGDLAEMRRLLLGHTADCADYDLRTPLHIAAACGAVDAIELLIDHHGNVNCMDKFGRTPLLEACRSRQLGAGKLLFNRGAQLGFSGQMTLQEQLPDELDMSESIKSSESGASSAAHSRRHSQVENRSSSDKHAKCVEGGELCQAASDVGQLWYLHCLLMYGADCNAGDYDARTALHVACASGNKPAVELLLEQATIEVSPCDNFGRTPLMEAVRHENEPCARLLTSRGASHGFIEDLRAASANSVIAGQELCQAAFANKQAYLFSLVVHCGISVDSADYDMRTALMLACAEGNHHVAITLVQHKANIQLKDRWGHTAITEARNHGHTDLAKLLEQMSAMQ